MRRKYAVASPHPESETIKCSPPLLTQRCQQGGRILPGVRIPALHLKETEMKNAVVWSEIAVSDLRRATAFYEKLLDGKLKAESFGPYELALFPHAADGVGGCLMKGEGYEPSGKGTVTYLAAEPGIDAALKRAAAAGAKVLMPKMALPGNQGFIAHVSDCEGNRIGLHAMS